MMEAAMEFRRKLTDGIVCLGGGISFCDPLVAEAMGASVDFLFIDLEHSGMSTDTMLRHLLAARARRVPGLVRVTHPDVSFIKPVLDGGADGIIAPQVRTLEEVRKVVAACRYPPEGTRGFGPRVPSDYARNGGREFLERANEGVFVGVQIETTEALDALDDILAVPNLDSVFIGPYDLSGALGMLGEIDHPKVVSAIETIVKRSRAAGVWVGAGMRTDPEYALKMARLGVQWMQVGSDFSLMAKGIDQITAAIRDRLGEG